MNILKRHVLQDSWGGTSDGQSGYSGGEYSGDMSPVQNMPANPWGGVQEGPATSPQTPQYQSDFLKNLFNNPETEYGDYGQINNPVVSQAVNAWAPVQEGMATIKAPQSMWGEGAMRQEYDANGEAQGFMTTPFAKGLMKAGIGLGRTALNSTPLGAMANVGYDMSQGVNPMRALAGAIPGYGGMVARGAADVAGGAPVGQVAGNALGGALGSQVGGYVGSQAGNAIGGSMMGALGGMGLSSWGGQQGAAGGRSLGGMMNASFNPGQQQQGLARPSFGVGDVASGLMGLYSAHQTGQQAQQNADMNQGALQGQISQLSSMYGQDSPYAQQLRQSLARKDAASGRNSQYGQREVQLQAALAEKAAQNAQAVSGLSQQSHAQNVANTNAQTMARNQQMGILAGMGKSSGFNDWAGGQLKDLWTQYGPSAQAQQPVYQAPSEQYQYNDSTQYT